MVIKFFCGKYNICAWLSINMNIYEKKNLQKKQKNTENSFEAFSFKKKNLPILLKNFMLTS